MLRSALKMTTAISRSRQKSPLDELVPDGLGDLSDEQTAIPVHEGDNTEILSNPQQGHPCQGPCRGYGDTEQPATVAMATSGVASRQAARITLGLNG